MALKLLTTERAKHSFVFDFGIVAGLMKGCELND